MSKGKIGKWQDRIGQIKQELTALGDMRPGSLSEQYNVCGNPRCRCKDSKQPRKHGPYYQLSYIHRGKHTTEFVKAEMVAELRRQLRNYRIFRQLYRQWVDLSVRIAKERKRQP